MTRIAVRIPISIFGPVAAFVVFVLLLAVSPAVREFAQGVLLQFRERPFSVVHIDGQVFETGLTALGLSPAQAVDIQYETAPSLRAADPGDSGIRSDLPGSPGGILSEPFEAIWEPVTGTISIRLEGLPAGGFGDSGPVAIRFEMPAAAVVAYAEDAATLGTLLDRSTPTGSGRFLVYGEIPVPGIVTQGAEDLPGIAETVSEIRLLPPRFRGQLRVVAEWLRFLIPTTAKPDRGTGPPPVLIEGLGAGDIVVWEVDGLIGILIGNVGGEVLLEIARRSG